ncbi:MAG: hypothetical protein C5B51_05755 [Terriglobia bacterium]|nr:MAG: hypothetical protein C5B51_05755 [Terriglobia bacterium]
MLWFYILFLSGLSANAASSLPPESIVERFVSATRGQAQAFEGSSMEVEIRASLPKLKKHGRLHALRRISAVGRIIYERPTFEGDDTVKKQVIARYLAGEIEAQTNKSHSMAVTPNNYNFKYKRDEQLDGRPAHVFSLTPKKRDDGMFKGEIWIDSDTYLEVKEAGSLVKNPSILIKRVSFLRKYAIRDGISIPTQLETVTETRLWGQAQLEVDYSNFSVDTPPPFVQSLDDDGQ